MVDPRILLVFRYEDSCYGLIHQVVMAKMCHGSRDPREVSQLAELYQAVCYELVQDEGQIWKISLELDIRVHNCRQVGVSTARTRVF